MTCRRIGDAIVCGSRRGIHKRRVMYCPCCKRRHRFVIRYGGAWYADTVYGACGDSWGEGEPLERPFQRGWRAKAQAEFREMWTTALGAAEYSARVRADIRESVA